METALVSQPQEVETSLQVAPSFSNLVASFLASQDVSQASRATYSRSLKRFISWLEASGRLQALGQLKREDILAFRDEMASSGLSSYTVSSYLTVTRKFFEWLEAEKIFPNIAKGIKGLKKPRGFRKDCLSPEQLKKALQAMDASRLEGLRDFALFNLVARTGLRTIEASRAMVGDIRQESGQPVLWIQGKGRDSKDDFVLLTPEALEPVKTYLQARKEAGQTLGDSAPLFCSHSDRNQGQSLTARSISRVIKEALRKVGLDDKRLSAHSLRHTAISLSIQNGASVEQARAMARHSDIKTTMIYFHNLDRVKDGAERFINF